MVRPTDQEEAVMKEGVFTHSSLEPGAMAHHVGPHGEAPGSMSRPREQRECMSKGFIVDFKRRNRLVRFETR